MRFTSLGSGSQGNALLVESAGGGATLRVLVDCGLGLRLVCDRLNARGIAPNEIDFILVTHEHADHVGGVAKLARHAGLPVLATHGTLHAAGAEFFGGVETIAISSHKTFSYGRLVIRPVPVPHDAREPIAVVFEDPTARLAVVTDLGAPTAFLRESLQGLTGLFLEFNHDRTMLDQGDYPQSLKARVGGGQGHLSNTQACEILKDCLHPALQVVIAAHLSQNNNHPDRVRSSVRDLAFGTTIFDIASQEAGFDWVSLASRS
ncbi:MAG: hypothetical protein RLZZ344_1185 [Pseudomonadota bacterium]|jgi:phosphoribosyl 1,2-cyclic phosphodiesterase